MVGIEQMIENATALSRSLRTAADDFVGALAAMRADAVVAEAQHKEHVVRLSREIEQLNEELARKREEHRQLERSLAVLKAQLREIFAEGDAARARVPWRAEGAR